MPLADFSHKSLVILTIFTQYPWLHNPHSFNCSNTDNKHNSVHLLPSVIIIHFFNNIAASVQLRVAISKSLKQALPKFASWLNSVEPRPTPLNPAQASSTGSTKIYLLTQRQCSQPDGGFIPSHRVVICTLLYFCSDYPRMDVASSM